MQCLSLFGLHHTASKLNVIASIIAICQQNHSFICTCNISLTLVNTQLIRYSFNLFQLYILIRKLVVQKQFQDLHF